jgi:hypothetical protein
MHSECAADHVPRQFIQLTVICIANLANHRSPRSFSDALPVTHCFARTFSRKGHGAWGIALKQGEGTANNAENANAGCSDIASSLAPWPCTRVICVFCVVCGSPYCWLIKPDTDAQRHQREGRTGRTSDRLTATSDERSFLLRAEAGCGWGTGRWWTIGNHWPTASSGRGDVRLREIVALEQQPGPIGLRAGIGKAIAHVEGGPMPPLAELGISLGCKL